MQQQVKILAVLHIVLSSLGILAGLIAFAVLGGLGRFVALADPSESDIAGGSVLSLIGVIAMVVIFAISIPGLIAGIGLLNYQPWARILTIIISAVELPAFPLHTALGIYGLYVLLSNDGATLFSRPAAQTRLQQF
jgi:hypothetical protein